MPASMKKLPNGLYEVRTPNGVHSHGSSKANAEAQVRLLNAIDHGFKPRKK